MYKLVLALVTEHSLAERPSLRSLPGLIGNEAEEAVHLDGMMIFLSYYINQFEESLALYEHCHGNLQVSFKKDGLLGNMDLSRYNAWMAIAGRDAAMNVYHFGKLLNSLRRRIRLCPTILPHFDGVAMEEARALYSQHFPSAVEIRHALSHSAEMAETPHKFAQNRGYGTFNNATYKGAFVLSSVSEDRLVLSREREILRFELNHHNANHLRDIASKVFSAFTPISNALGSATQPEPFLATSNKSNATSAVIRSKGSQ